MPCKCSGYRYEKCRCSLVGPVFPVSTSKGQFMLVSQKDSGYLKQSDVRPAKRNIILRVIERMYEKCAGYNLRYCPFRGYIGTKSCLNEALKDLVVLCCFLLANFVVLAILITRMTMHMSLVIAGTARWIKRSLRTKETTCITYARPINPIYPPITKYRNHFSNYT